MTRICLIGDSHAAALIEGCRGLNLSHEIQVFAYPGMAVDHLATAEQSLSCLPEMAARLEALGMAPSVDLGNCDAVLLVGCGLSIQAATTILRRHEPPEIAAVPPQGRAFWFRRLPRLVPAPRALMSDACFSAALEGAIAATRAMALLALLRQVTAVPVMLVAEPFPSIDLLHADRKGHYLRRVIEAGEAPFARAAFHDALRRSLQRFENAHLVPQPPELTEAEIFTPRDLTADALRMFDLKSRFPGGEFWHANGRYGAVMIEASLAALSAAII